mmetsp:Transcript_3866/g.10936  ORF Transcript_3866/g.10936 Transcript_3866/m.10936 type:complete len:218 (-) Transcript_3866:40-693(-)
MKSYSKIDISKGGIVFIDGSFVGRRYHIASEKGDPLTMIAVLWPNEICGSHPSISNGLHFVHSMEFAYVIKCTVQTIEKVRHLNGRQQPGDQIGVANNIREEDGAHHLFFGLDLLPVPKSSGNVSRKHVEQQLVGSGDVRIFQSPHFCDWARRSAGVTIQIIKSIVLGGVCAGSSTVNCSLLFSLEVLSIGGLAGHGDCSRFGTTSARIRSGGPRMG